MSGASAVEPGAAHGWNLDRRRFLALTGSVAGATLLSACGKFGGSSSASGVVELRYLNHWGVDNTHKKPLAQLIKDFEAQNPKIKVKNDVVDANTTEPKTKTDCAAGDCPDIIHQTEPLYLKSGWLLDLTPYVVGEWKSRFVPATLDALTFEGKLSALPLEVSPLASIWNTALIADVGGQIPTTWEEMLELGELAKAKGKYLLTFAASNSIPNDLIWGHPAGPAAMAAGQWDNDAIRFAAQAIKDVYDRKLIASNDADLDYAGGVALFQQRKVLFFGDGDWTIGNNLLPNGQDKFGLQKDVAFTPGVRPVPDGKRAVRYFSNGVGLSSALAKNQTRLDAALKFMNFWTTKDRAEKWLAEGATPTGVDVAVPTSIPLMGNFLNVPKAAETVYTAVQPDFMAAGIWGHWTPLRDAIAQGKSVDDAVKAYVAAQVKAAAA